MTQRPREAPDPVRSPRPLAAPPEAIVAGAVYDRQTIVRWLGGRKSWAALQRGGLKYCRLGAKS